VSIVSRSAIRRWRWPAGSSRRCWRAAPASE
jgi:hypothetical protein